MITYLQRLTAERDSLTQAATDLAGKAAAEDRDLTETEHGSMRGWQERCAQIDAQLTEYNAQAESQRAYARLRDGLAHDDAGDPPAVETRGAGGPVVTWGEAFTESDQFRAYPGAGTSARVTLAGGLPALETRDAYGGRLETRAPIDTGDAPTVPTLYTPSGPAVRSPLLSVCGRLQAGSNAVSYVQWAPNPPSAAPVVAEGEAKPEATMTATPVSDTLDTYAHWKEVTRQALEDIPQIRSIVETRLRQGIVRSVETAIVAALAGATIPPASGSAAQGLLGAIRIGLATVQANGYDANAVLLNPMDAADIDLGVMGGTLGGPVTNGSLWGLRPVPSPDVPAGTAYVGDFSAGVVVFDRGTTDVYLTDSHADNFVKNILLLLAEVRALATVPEPQAIAECTAGVVTAAASGGGGN